MGLDPCRVVDGGFAPFRLVGIVQLDMDGEHQAGEAEAVAGGVGIGIMQRA